MAWRRWWWRGRRRISWGRGSGSVGWSGGGSGGPERWEEPETSGRGGGGPGGQRRGLGEVRCSSDLGGRPASQAGRGRLRPVTVPLQPAGPAAPAAVVAAAGGGVVVAVVAAAVVVVVVVVVDDDDDDVVVVVLVLFWLTLVVVLAGWAGGRGHPAAGRDWRCCSAGSGCW